MITFKKLGNYGRLGNQLFQIASTIGIATKNSQSFEFPLWSYQKYFKNRLPILTGSNFVTYKEPSYKYIEPVLDSYYNWSLDGYFQSWKYFEHCKDFIKYYFTFDTVVTNFDDVAVHVRRGDYIDKQNIHPVLPISYYQKAFNYFKGLKFTIFSDDIEWCKQNLQGENISYFPTSIDIIDLQIMTGYTKFIIANSSYSYWAAYLSSLHNDTVIVAPRDYVIGEEVNDRIPPEWIRL